MKPEPETGPEMNPENPSPKPAQGAREYYHAHHEEFNPWLEPFTFAESYASELAGQLQRAPFNRAELRAQLLRAAELWGNWREDEAMNLLEGIVQSSLAASEQRLASAEHDRDNWERVLLAIERESGFVRGDDDRSDIVDHVRQQLEQLESSEQRLKELEQELEALQAGARTGLLVFMAAGDIGEFSDKAKQQLQLVINAREKSVKQAGECLTELVNDLFRRSVEQTTKGQQRVRELEQALRLVLDQVDYTSGACGLNEMIGAVLPREILGLVKEAVKQ